MRKAFTRTLVELAEADPRILLLTGDLGYMALEPFAERFPNRFLNAGVAEQNMVGVATGLAEAGFIPFVYSIVTFATLRPYEFIRNGPVLHRLPVRVVGVGGGFEYGPQGATHHGLEDLGVMRVQPGMAVVAAADHRQYASALRATWNLPGPVYYRIGKDDETVVPGLDGRFRVGHAELVRPGRDVCLVATGSVAVEAAAAAATLAEQGVDCGCLIVASLQPAPADDIAAALEHASLAVTVEAHYATGGLGSLVSEVVAERGLRCRVRRCAVSTTPDGVSGSQRFMHQAHGLNREALVTTALKALGNTRR